MKFGDAIYVVFTLLIIILGEIGYLDLLGIRNDNMYEPRLNDLKSVATEIAIGLYFRSDMTLILNKSDK